MDNQYYYFVYAKAILEADDETAEICFFHSFKNKLNQENVKVWFEELRGFAEKELNKPVKTVIVKNFKEIVE